MKTGMKSNNKYTFNRTEYKKGKSFGTGALDFENLVYISYIYHKFHLQYKPFHQLYIYITLFHIEQRFFR